MSFWQNLETSVEQGEGLRVGLFRQLLGVPEVTKAPIVDHAAQERVNTGLQHLDAQEKASRGTMDYVLGGK